MSQALALQRRAPVLQLLALVALFLYGAATIEGFSSEITVDSMLVLAALLGLAALGQTLVLILGGIDFSVPGHIAMGAIVVSELYGARGWSAPLAIALVAVAAGVLGAATGWICHRWRIQPLIVTLGIGAISAGAAVAWTQGHLTGVAPPFLTTLTTATGTTFGLAVPPVVVLWALIAVAVALLLHRTAPGRRLYATGANPRAAALARIDTKRVWVVVFAAERLPVGAHRLPARRLRRCRPDGRRPVPVQPAHRGDRRRHDVHGCARRLHAHGRGRADPHRPHDHPRRQGLRPGRPADRLRRPHPARRGRLRPRAAVAGSRLKVQPPKEGKQCASVPVLIVAVVGVAVLGISTAAQAASSRKVNMLGKGGQTGVNLKSTYKGKPFGTCKMTGKLVIPDTQQTWKCKGGSFKLVGHGTTGAANDAKGTWKITKGSGTGKYKGISGKGTFSGKLSTGTFRYKGKARC